MGWVPPADAAGREVRFFFRRDAEALLGALWCLDMMGHVGFMRFGLRVVEGKALLEIGIDRRTSPGGAVCTMWNIL